MHQIYHTSIGISLYLRGAISWELYIRAPTPHAPAPTPNFSDIIRIRVDAGKPFIGSNHFPSTLKPVIYSAIVSLTPVISLCTSLTKTSHFIEQLYHFNRLLYPKLHQRNHFCTKFYWIIIYYWKQLFNSTIISLKILILYHFMLWTSLFHLGRCYLIPNMTSFQERLWDRWCLNSFRLTTKIGIIVRVVRLASSTCICHRKYSIAVII